jgi:hypothetical protein
MDTPTEQVIQQTKTWVDEVVIGLNLCPFASRVVSENRIDYIVVRGDSLEQHLHQLADCFSKLDESSEIETSLIIFPQAYKSFDDYLELLELSNQLLEELNYAGIYQLASFHPEYLFADSTEDDASNFTNRSPYPMLHLLRESSIEKAVASYKNIDDIPDNNIKKLQKIGYTVMQQMLNNIMQEKS